MALFDMIIPVALGTPGADYASEVNNDLLLVRNHTHTDGDGYSITPAALNINDDIQMGSHSLLAVRTINFIPIAAPSSPYNTNGFYVNSVDNNLYYGNNGGVPIQLTNGNTLNAIVPVSGSYPALVVNTNYAINASSTFVIYEIDTTSARTISLPRANAVLAGKFYIFKDVTGLAGTNNITIVPQAAAGDTIEGSGSNLVMSRNFLSLTLVSNGSSNWMVLPNSTTAINNGTYDNVNVLTLNPSSVLTIGDNSSIALLGAGNTTIVGDLRMSGLLTWSSGGWTSNGMHVGSGLMTMNGIGCQINLTNSASVNLATGTVMTVGDTAAINFTSSGAGRMNGNVFSTALYFMQGSAVTFRTTSVLSLDGTTNSSAAFNNSGTITNTGTISNSNVIVNAGSGHYVARTLVIPGTAPASLGINDTDYVFITGLAVNQNLTLTDTGATVGCRLNFYTDGLHTLTLLQNDGTTNVNHGVIDLISGHSQWVELVWFGVNSWKVVKYGQNP